MLMATSPHNAMTTVRPGNHSRPSRARRVTDGLARVFAYSDLVPEPRHNEKRVVDGYRQADHHRQSRGGRLYVYEPAQRGHNRHRQPHAKDGGEQWQSGGHKRAESDNEHKRGDHDSRQISGTHLGNRLQSVAADLHSEPGIPARSHGSLQRVPRGVGQANRRGVIRNLRIAYRPSLIDCLSLKRIDHPSDLRPCLQLVDHLLHNCPVAGRRQSLSWGSSEHDLGGRTLSRKLREAIGK